MPRVEGGRRLRSPNWRSGGAPQHMLQAITSITSFLMTVTILTTIITITMLTTILQTAMSLALLKAELEAAAMQLKTGQANEEKAEKEENKKESAGKKKSRREGGGKMKRGPRFQFAAPVKEKVDRTAATLAALERLDQVLLLLPRSFSSPPSPLLLLIPSSSSPRVRGCGG